MRSYSVGLACLLLPSCSLLFDASPNRALDGGPGDTGDGQPTVDADVQILDARRADSAGPDADLSGPGCTMRLGAVAWWRGEADAADSSTTTGNHPGTNMGTVGYGPGKVGKAFRFSGSNRIRVNDANDAFLFDGPFSVELWVKVDGNFPAIPAILVGKDQCPADTCAVVSDAGSKWLLQLTASQNAHLILNENYSAGMSGQTALGINGLDFGSQFHHLVGTFDGSRLDIYLDGVQKGGLDAPPGAFADADTTRPLYIGNNFENQGFDGWIDEIVYYDHALTQADVTTLYQNTCVL